MRPPLDIPIRLVADTLAWLRHRGRAIDFTERINVERVDGAYGERSKVTIDDRLPDADAAAARWRITTVRLFLPRAHFTREVRAKVAEASTERGRHVSCIDLETQQVMAALTYHVDEDPKVPILITSIGMRIDDGAPRELYDQSRACAAIVKQYLHAVARKTGRDGAVYIDAEPNSGFVSGDLSSLGFRRAKQIKGKPPSAAYWRQDELRD